MLLQHVIHCTYARYTCPGDVHCAPVQRPAATEATNIGTALESIAPPTVRDPAHTTRQLS